MNGYSKLVILSILIIIICFIVYFIVLKNDEDVASKELSLKINSINEYISNNKIDIGEKINIPLYYINLDRSQDRRKTLESQLKDTTVNARRVPAVDGKKIVFHNNSKPYEGTGEYIFENNENIKFKIKGFDKCEKNTDLACTMSHLIAINTAYKNGDELALIVEDDILLNISSIWKEDIKSIIKTVPEDWGIIQLFTSLEYKNVQKCEKYIEWNDYYGCVAYIVNKKFMKINAKFFKEDRFEIINKYNFKRLVSDFLIYRYAQKENLGVYTLFPRFIPDNRNLSSSLHDEHTKEHIEQSNKIISNYVVEIGQQGRALEYGEKFMKNFLERVYDTTVVYNTSHPKLYVNSHFGKIKNFNPFITWSGESHRVEKDKKSLLNLLSFSSNHQNDVWIPYILFNIDEEKIEKLVNKNFAKMNERKNFLAYINSNCVEKRESLFSEILKIRPDVHALGKCSNNKKLDEKDYHKNGEILENYRFAIAMENLDKDGYITEKIINAYLGGTIPIYSGGKNTAEKFFKKGTYIDVNDFATLEECAKFICELDKNLDKLQELQDLNIFKDDKVPEMFQWYEKDNSYMNDLVKLAKSKIFLM